MRKVRKSKPPEQAIKQYTLYHTVVYTCPECGQRIAYEGGTMMKRKIRYMAYSAIYTARIHANVLCRLRFLAIKAIAKPEYWPAHHKWCPTCKYRCLQRAGVYERAREAWGIKEGDQ